MSKRSKKIQSSDQPTNSPAVDAIVADTATIETTVETAETETAVEIDADVLAALAGGEPDDGTVTVLADELPEITAEDVDPPSEEEVLAALTATPTAADPAAPKAKRAAKAAPVMVRAFTDVASIDQAALDTAIAGCNAKKVKEKAENMVAAITTGKKLSNYTALAAKLAKTDGKISGKSLVEMFQANNLSIGTSRAQAQQMTALFKMVGLAAQDNGSKDLIVTDAKLLDELVSIAA